MAHPVKRTAHGDAPLSAAKHPDAAAAGLQARSDDALFGYTVCISRARGELYGFWRDFSHLPAFMENVHSVTVQSPTRSHRVIAAPAGRTVEWDSQITEDIPDERIAWTSLEGADVRNAGVVEFRDSPTGRGTVVTVTIAYDPPVGELGRLVAKLFHRRAEDPGASGPSGPSWSRRTSRMRKCSSSPTSCRPDGWPPRTAKSRPTTPLRSGVADR